MSTNYYKEQHLILVTDYITFKIIRKLINEEAND